LLPLIGHPRRVVAYLVAFVVVHNLLSSSLRITRGSCNQLPESLSRSTVILFRFTSSRARDRQ